MADTELTAGCRQPLSTAPGWELLSQPGANPTVGHQQCSYPQLPVSPGLLAAWQIRRHVLPDAACAAFKGRLSLSAITIRSARCLLKPDLGTGQQRAGLQQGEAQNRTASQASQTSIALRRLLRPRDRDGYGGSAVTFTTASCNEPPAGHSRDEPGSELPAVLVGGTEQHSPRLGVGIPLSHEGVGVQGGGGGGSRSDGRSRNSVVVAGMENGTAGSAVGADTFYCCRTPIKPSRAVCPAWMQPRSLKL